MMVGNNLKDTQLQQIVDKTILFADKDEDGKISFEEFCNVVGNTDIHKKMVCIENMFCVITGKFKGIESLFNESAGVVFVDKMYVD
nr:unnamed protein product [Callosobruchus chinensis]